MPGKRKRLLIFGLAVALAGPLSIQPASATLGSEKDAPAAAKLEATPAPPSPGPSGKETSGANANIELELREVKQLLQAQQQRIEALEMELKAVRSSAKPLPAATPSDPRIAAPIAQNQEVLEKKLESNGGKLRGIGPFTFSGDFRLRDEPFFGGPSDQSLVRNRERFRLRFDANVRLNDDLGGGFSLASGDVNDPISTNQTTNQFYTRKPFVIDRAFLKYTPHDFKFLTLSGGKFAYPWYNTELTWDKDLNPEGLAQTLSWNFESIPVLKKIALVGFELPFTEIAGTALANKSIVQSVTYGGQLQTTWELASWLKFSAYSGFYNFHNADPIALALAGASSRNPQTPFVGLLSLGSGGNTIQNSITTTTATAIVTVNGTAYPTGDRTVTSAQFASKFGLFDSIARFDVKTRYERWPIAVIGDYVQNTRACGNVSNILPAPANTATARYSQSSNAPCESRQRRGYWGEARFGRAQERGDWQFAYTRIVIEREAVLGAFNFSDLRQGTNVTEHRVEAYYQFYRNVQLGLTGLIGRPLNFGNAAPPEPLLKRLQFDVLYKF